MNTNTNSSTQIAVIEKQLTFKFGDRELHPVATGDDILFNANEVCDALGYVNSRDALARFVKDVDDVVKRDTIDSMGRNQVANFITEPGLYALIFGSEMKEAEKFKRWVTHDVLPSIRKKGFYESPAYLQLKADAAQTKTLLLEQTKLKAKNWEIADRNEYLEGKRSLLIDDHAVLQMTAAFNEVSAEFREFQERMFNGPEWPEGTSKSDARCRQKLVMEIMRDILRNTKNIRAYFAKSEIGRCGCLGSYLDNLEYDAKRLWW